MLVQHHRVGIAIEFFETQATVVLLLNFLYCRFQRLIPNLVDVLIVDGVLKVEHFQSARTGRHAVRHIASILSMLT